MPPLKVTPKDFFLWIGAMLALYGSIVAFITLLFEYIDHAYPDPLNYYVDPYSDAIRFSMAALIVLVPVALLLMRLIRNDIVEVPEKSGLWIRRWVLMLTVFVAGATIVVDLITLINIFLGGEMTMRFILKVAVVFLVAGAAFLHFLSDLRGYWVKEPGRAKLVGYGVGVLVLATIISGFIIIGTPGQVRLMRFDNQKATDLQSIQWQIVNFWQQKERLPENLAELEDPLGGYTNPQDPQTNELYEYQKTGDVTFRLCATFNAPSLGSTGATMPVRAYGSLEENWQHAEGRECFDRTIDPERYPPYTKPLL